MDRKGIQQYKNYQETYVGKDQGACGLRSENGDFWEICKNIYQIGH